jgi:hypothetical protein
LHCAIPSKSSDFTGKKLIFDVSWQKSKKQAQLAYHCTNVGVNDPLSEYGNPIPQPYPNPKIGPTAEADKKKPIMFIDVVGRKFSYPFELCCTWAVRTNSFVWMHY